VDTGYLSVLKANPGEELVILNGAIDVRADDPNLKFLEDTEKKFPDPTVVLELKKKSPG
jgi:hypothetical protein